MTIKSTPIEEGEISFEVPSIKEPCKTWYRVYGDLSSNLPPLIALHGGPGVGHNYLLSLADLAIKKDRPVILYDQLGCGKSTHLRFKNGDTAFWTVQLFLSELNNLIAHFKLKSYDLFGNSWGGMLASEHAITKPSGLRKVIIADSPASMVDWVHAAEKLRSRLPKDIQEILGKHEKDGTTDSEEYEAAVQVFYKKHVCRLDPWPEEVSQTFELLNDDSTVYMTMNGPSEFFVTGSLKNWSVKGKLGKIEVPTLLLNGRFDEAADEVVLPFWDEIKKVKWYTFAESSHMPHWEERERFMEVVSEFLGS